MIRTSLSREELALRRRLRERPVPKPPAEHGARVMAAAREAVPSCCGRSLTEPQARPKGLQAQADTPAKPQGLVRRHPFALCAGAAAAFAIVVAVAVLHVPEKSLETPGQRQGDATRVALAPSEPATALLQEVDQRLAQARERLDGFRSRSGQSTRVARGGRSDALLRRAETLRVSLGL